MRKLRILSLLCLLAAAMPARAAYVPEPQNLFDFAERSWAVGVISLGKPLTFRNGGVLAFPSQIDELVWAPKGTKPRNLMLIYEVGTNERDNPYFKEHDVFLAPIRLLPEHSYWKDNLPNTPRHEIAGGRRYAFRGDDVPGVKRILAEYLAATEERGLERGPAEVRAVVGALGSNLSTVREDAVSFLTRFPTLNRDFDQADVAGVASYLAGDAPAEEKASLLDALVTANVTLIKPSLTELAKRDDATGAAALRSLDRLGSPEPTEQVLARSHSTSVEMRAYAAEALGKRAAADVTARKRAAELLDDKDPTVVTAAAKGLGEAGGDDVAALLGDELREGGVGSKQAAESLAAIGSPVADAILIKTLKENSGTAATSAVYGLSRTSACSDCRRTLEEQFESHPDPAVRQFIGIVLAVPLSHKH